MVVIFCLLFSTFSIEWKNPRVSVVKKLSCLLVFKHTIDINSRRVSDGLPTKTVCTPTVNLLSERVVATRTSAFTVFLLLVYTGKRVRVCMILD